MLEWGKIVINVIVMSILTSSMDIYNKCQPGLSVYHTIWVSHVQNYVCGRKLLLWKIKLGCVYCMGTSRIRVISLFTLIKKYECQNCS